MIRVLPSVDGRAQLGKAEWVLRAVGLAIWAFLGVRGMSLAWQGAWLFPWAIYGVAFCLTSVRRLPPSAGIVLLGIQTGAALSTSALGLPGFEGLMMSVVAAESPTVLRLRESALWAALQWVPLIAYVWRRNTHLEVFEIFGAYTAFAAFALMAYGLQAREVRARSELAAANAELLATRELLAERARLTERLHISRELHDTLGHHLTALSIQLDLAGRLVEGKARDAVRESHALCRRMLGEVRAIVSALREDGTVDLTAALRGLPLAFTEPAIHCEVPAELPLLDPVRALVVFRCAQEALTNAVKHSGAKNIWLVVRCKDGGVDLSARDDGKGATGLKPGNGLSGMRERLDEVGGFLEVLPSPGQGFEVRVWVPGVGRAT